MDRPPPKDQSSPRPLRPQGPLVVVGNVARDTLVEMDLNQMARRDPESGG
jgi:hypothetical protein